MDIIFTRHAKRRMKLYNITKTDVIHILSTLGKSKVEAGKNEIIASVKKFVYPIKVIFKKKNEDFIIVTAYPLKRGRNENIL